MRSNKTLNSMVEHYQNTYSWMIGFNVQTNEKSSYGKGTYKGKVVDIVNGLATIRQFNGMPAFISFDNLEILDPEYVH